MKLWNKLLDEYYQKTNKKQYQQIILSEKHKWLLRNKIITCTAALMLINNNEATDDVKNTLNYFGYNISNLEKIESALNKEKSHLKLLVSKSKLSSNKEEINFWKLLINVEDAIGRQLDIQKISVAYWIELIALIKNKKTANGRKRGPNRKV